MELYAFKRNNFILYKLIPCLILIMFFIMFFYGSNVYAFTVNLEDSYIITNSTYDEIYPYYIVIYDNIYQSYSYLCCDSPIIIDNNYIKPINSESRLYYPTCGSFVLPADNSTYSLFSIENLQINPDRYPIMASNHDILDGNGDLLFQAPSQTQTIVASQVGEVEMERTLSEILGILPVVIVVLVGLIAIRKGIQFLMVRMKKA